MPLENERPRLPDGIEGPLERVGICNFAFSVLSVNRTEFIEYPTNQEISYASQGGIDRPLAPLTIVHRDRFCWQALVNLANRWKDCSRTRSVWLAARLRAGLLFGVPFLKWNIPAGLRRSFSPCHLAAPLPSQTYLSVTQGLIV